MYVILSVYLLNYSLVGEGDAEPGVEEEAQKIYIMFDFVLM